jgi:tRNA (uracil-5-)-methyltransferase
MASEELTQALQGVRPFRRLAGIDLTRFQFSTVLVDPPRAGLDAATRELVSSMPSILYISCNPDTLHRDIEHLQQTHRVASLAIFDQFPYTHHIECGVLLIAL